MRIAPGTLGSQRATWNTLLSRSSIAPIDAPSEISSTRAVDPPSTGTELAASSIADARAVTLGPGGLSVGAGDYDRNGVVDMADYVVWRNSKGTTVAVGSMVGNGADGDRSGMIDDNDYGIWRANLGNVRGISSGGAGAAAASSVPEPAAAILAVFGAMALSGRRRRWA